MFPVHLLEKYELICVSMAADKKVHQFCFLLTLQLFSIICHEIIPFQGGKKKVERNTLQKMHLTLLSNIIIA